MVSLFYMTNSPVFTLSNSPMLTLERIWIHSSPGWWINGGSPEIKWECAIVCWYPPWNCSDYDILQSSRFFSLKPIGSMYAILMVTWIPSIYPSHVSIFLPAPLGSVMGNDHVPCVSTSFPSSPSVTSRRNYLAKALVEQAELSLVSLTGTRCEDVVQVANQPSCQAIYQRCSNGFDAEHGLQLENLSDNIRAGWWLIYLSDKYESQLVWLFPIDSNVGENKNTNQRVIRAS